VLGELLCVLFGLLLAGCAAQLDLTEGEPRELGQPDAGAPGGDASLPLPCSAGTYMGEFWTSNGPFAFEGGIAFDLTAASGSDAMPIANDATLAGEDASGAVITARIIGEGSCQTGSFDASLRSGIFESGGINFAFEGTVTGKYMAEPVPAFYGTWAAVAEVGVESDGVWYAVHVPPPEGSLR
jgi:hypothetical protein